MPVVRAFVEEPVDESLYDKYLLKAIFLAGAGGSGKSKVSDAMFGGEGLKVISADVHLERFLKAAAIPLSDVGQQYGLFRKARDAMKAELRQYAQRRLGLIIDSTGWDYQRVAKPVRKLRQLGYDCYMVFVTTTLEKALARNLARAEAGGRDVPDSFVEDAWRGAHRNIGKYTRLFGLKNMLMIDNNVDVKTDDWVGVIMPKLRKVGQKILDKPLKSRRGKTWLKQQQDPKTRTLNKSGATEWPKPEPPKPVKLLTTEGVVSDSMSLLPPVLADFGEALCLALDRTLEQGHLLVHDAADLTDSGPSRFVEVTPTRVVLFERESTGVAVPLAEFSHTAGEFIEESFLPLRPIPLEERHWRDNPKDFRARLKIEPEKPRPGARVSIIGKSAKDGKIYAWSHRAYHGFGKGDTFFPKLKWNPQNKPNWTTYDQDAWEKELRDKQPKIKTEKEARQSALNFARWVR